MQAPNFTDTEILVHCVPGDYLGKGASRELCQKVAVLFENQGAKVQALASTGVNPDDLEDVSQNEGDPTPRDTKLVVELRARRIHESYHPWSWLACFASFTIVPGMNEFTFAQDVVIKDSDGVLLARDSMKGRIVKRFGGAHWAINMLTNLATRKKKDRHSGHALGRDLSHDLYGQLSQLAYNARVQSQVLAEAKPGGPIRGRAVGAPAPSTISAPATPAPAAPAPTAPEAAPSTPAPAPTTPPAESR